MLQSYSGSYDKKLYLKTHALQPFVLSDYSVVITKTSINRFFGHTGKSDWLNEFMQGFTRYSLGATGLLQQLSNPILFETTKKDGVPTLEEGYTVKTILDSCDFILFAKKEGFIGVIELGIANIAESLLATHQSGPLDHQIAELTGFNLLKWKARQKIREALSVRQKEHAHSWIEGLTAGFWPFLFSQLQTDWKAVIQNPVPAAKFIHDWVFARLPEAVMEELRSSTPKRTYRSKKGPQSIENERLSEYLHLLLGLYGVSESNLSILDQLLSKSHPKRRTAAFAEELPAQPLPIFAKQLQEAVSLKK